MSCGISKQESPPKARGVPPLLLSPPDTIDGVEMGRYLKRAACMGEQKCHVSTLEDLPSPLGPLPHLRYTISPNSARYGAGQGKGMS